MWDKDKIKIELIKRGSNFTKAALDADISAGGIRTALVKPFPAGERALAKALMGRKKVLAAKMLEQGLSSNTIAAELDIHERTVRRVKEKNYLDLPLISYIEEQERKENEKNDL